MKRRVLGVLLLLASTGQAEAAGWDDLGGLLSKACNVNNVGGVPIETGENLRWVCQLRSMHYFISDNIINGDWAGFAKDVIGKYASEYLNHLGEYMGVSELNAYTEELNEALRGDYNKFRSTMYGAVANIMKNRRDVNEGFAKDTAGGIAQTAINSNPNLTLSNRAARLQDALEATESLDNAYKAKKAQEEASKALEANTAPALATATDVVGLPGREGRADAFSKQAATAVSAREVAELQVKLDAEQMKQDATFSVALLNQLGEMVQQQVMTNNQLMLERKGREEDMLSQEEEINQEIEALAQENLDSAIEYGKAITGAYANADSVLSGTAEELDFGEVVP
jgi:myosin heavy subunit